MLTSLLWLAVVCIKLILRHLLGCSFSPALCIHSNTCFKLQRCHQRSYLLQLCHQCRLHNRSIEGLTVPYPLVAEKLQEHCIIKRHNIKLKQAPCVQNAVFSLYCGSTSTCQYPLFKSSVEKHFEPARVSKVSSILGMG